jgi:hypothetical protein
VKRKEDLPSSTGSRIFLCGLLADVKVQLSALLEIKVSDRSTYADTGKIIKEAEKIVVGLEDMLTFTLDGKPTGSGLEKVVKKTVAVRNESNTSKDSKAQGPAQLQDDFCEALERLKLTRVGRSIAQHAVATSTDPAYISARGNGEQFALATNYINTHFIDDYSTPAGYRLSTQVAIVVGVGAKA